MKIRLNGTRAECVLAAYLLGSVMRVDRVSNVYPDNSTPTRLRVYLTVTLPASPQAKEG